MDAIVLCGGFGTRLLPLTKHTPKALLDVAGRPVIDYTLPQLLDIQGLKAIHLVANACFFGQFYTWRERWEDQLRERGIHLHLHNDAMLTEEKRLGSVGDLAFVLRTMGELRPVLLMGDDTIVRFPLSKIAEQFQRGSENIVLAFPESSHQLRQRLVVVEFGDDDIVTHFHEHPEHPPTEWVSPLVYFLQPEALEHVSAYLARNGTSHDSLTQFMDYLAERERVRAIRIPGQGETRTWFDIESKYMYRRANEVLSEEPLMLEGLF